MHTETSRGPPTMEDAKLRNGSEIESALQAVGELLAADDFRFGVVVIGGATLNLLGVVDRATRDVDVVAVRRRASHHH